VLGANAKKNAIFFLNNVIFNAQEKCNPIHNLAQHLSPITIDPWYPWVYGSKETTSEEKPRMLGVLDSFFP
jgi:hypothetical protein